MSRAHAVAPDVANVPYRGSVQGMRAPGPGVASRPRRPLNLCYVERAMLLWPRLDRAKLRKFADDPARIAEIVGRRTSQPYDAILAMLTRQTNRLTSLPDDNAGFDSRRSEPARTSLRIVRSEEGTEIEVQDLLPA